MNAIPNPGPELTTLARHELFRSIHESYRHAELAARFIDCEPHRFIAPDDPALKEVREILGHVHDNAAKAFSASNVVLVRMNELDLGMLRLAAALNFVAEIGTCLDAGALDMVAGHDLHGFCHVMAKQLESLREDAEAVFDTP